MGEVRYFMLFHGFHGMMCDELFAFDITRGSDVRRGTGVEKKEGWREGGR